MKLKTAIQFSILFLMMIFSQTAISQIQFGVFADCQYCNCETVGNRYYKYSLEKLENCIQQFNRNQNLEFVVGLGDLIDRDLASFDSVNVVLAGSNKNVYHVAGNHDFSVEKEKLNMVHGKLNLTDIYYSFVKKDWMFIFLNGNELTVNSNDPKIVEQAEKMLSKLELEKKPNSKNWNGGMSQKQIHWMEEQLQRAENKKLKVALFCHYPLLPLEAHALWNSEDVLNVLEKYKNVKLWLNGHNHAGNYAFHKGVNFINLKGMVETKTENAFAVVMLSDKQIIINGFGREPDRKFSIQ